MINTFTLEGVLKSVTEKTSQRGTTYSRIELTGMSGKGKYEKAFTYDLVVFSVPYEQLKQSEGGRVKITGFIEPYTYQINGESKCKPDFKAMTVEALSGVKAHSKQKTMGFEDDDIPF